MTPTRGKRPDQHDFTAGPLLRPMLVFTLPLIGTSLLQSLNGSVNSIWVGRFLGPQALAATANANLLLFLLLGAIFGVASAASIFVGQAVGAGDIARAKRIVGTGASFFIGLAILVAALCWGLTPLLLRAMGTPDDTVAMATTYLRVCFLSLPFSYLFLFVIMMVRAGGGARTPFVFLVLSVILDIVVNPLLIFGWGPLPGFGIAGSAASTVVAQGAALAGLLISLYRNRHPLRLGRADIGLLRPDGAIAAALARKGLPMGMQTIVVSSSAVVMISLVNGFGSKATAGFGAASQLWNFVQMPAMAVSMTLSTVAAQNIGAARWDRVGQATGAAMAIQLVLTGLLVGLLYLFDDSLLGLYTRDPAALAVSKHANLQVAWGFILLGGSFVLFGAMRAAGAVGIPLAVSILALWVVRLPFGLALLPRWGIDALWWSMPLGGAVALAMTAAYYFSGRWRTVGLGLAKRPAA